MSLQDFLPAPTLLPTLHELDLFRSVPSSVPSSCPGSYLDVLCRVCRCFQSVLVHVQVLWELVLLGEPLVVMAPSPTLSSEVVLALVRYQPIREERGR